MSRERAARFEMMMAAYRRSGGVATDNELVALMQPHREQPVSTVARWIVSRRALSFNWEAQTFFPLFQYEPATMRLRDGMAEVLTELVDVFDNWDLAVWFANPNPWLDDIAPADLLAERPDQVRDAARVDRFMGRQ